MKDRTRAGQLSGQGTKPLSSHVSTLGVNDFDYILLLIKNRPSKMKFFWYQGIFFREF